MPNSASNRQADAPTASDWASLVDLQREHAAEIRVIKTGYNHLTQQMAEITVTLHAQDRRIEENAKQLAAIAGNVETNTKMTGEALSMLQDVRDAVTAASVLSKAGKYLAGMVLTGSAVWIAIKDFINFGGKP